MKIALATVAVTLPGGSKSRPTFRLPGPETSCPQRVAFSP